MPRSAPLIWSKNCSIVEDCDRARAQIFGFITIFWTRNGFGVEGGWTKKRKAKPLKGGQIGWLFSFHDQKIKARIQLRATAC
jgi:hypothetical protein